MIVRAIDADNDWTFGKGKNDYKSGVKATQQNLKTRLQSFLGDCFFDSSAGVDWFNLLGNKNQVAITLAVSSVILNTQDVTAILSLSIDISDTRSLSIIYSVETVYGKLDSFIESTVG